MMARELPIPAHFNADKVGQVWRVPYQDRAREAQAWARQHNIKPAASDKIKTCLMAIDVQNTFCLPDFALFVGGRSGRGAIDDNVRLGKFIYGILVVTTEIDP